MPKISVVMSVYKEPVDWMRQSIESIINQTFTDFEFIIINDKPDREENAQLLNEYAQKDNRIKIITNEENIGLTKSLNKGISVAKGEYIARMDADDISLPNRFSVQMSFLEEHPNMAVCSSGCYIIDEDNNIIGERNRELNYQKIKNNLIFECPLVHPSVIFKRSVDSKVVQYDESIRYAQDYALWVEICKNHEVHILPQKLVRYRKSGSQISTKRLKEQNEFAFIIIGRAIEYFHIQITEEQKEFFLAFVKNGSKEYSCNQIEEFIMAFYAQNKSNKIVEPKEIVRKLILYYVRFLYKKYSFQFSIHRLIVVSVKLRYYSIYCMASLVSKYIFR